MSESFAESTFGVFRPLDGVRACATRLCDFREVDGMQLNTEFRISFEDHLLPFDLAEHVVLNHYNGYAHFVFHQGREFCHQHTETAVADDTNNLATRVCRG